MWVEEGIFANFSGTVIAVYMSFSFHVVANSDSSPTGAVLPVPVKQILQYL
jgi:hypothetical protein